MSLARQIRSTRRIKTSRETAIRSDSHVPIRTCVGCRRRRPRAEMFRSVLVDGALRIDLHGPGRGAWICGRACVAEASRRGAFDRAFRRRVDREKVDALEASWDDGAG